MTIPPFPTFAAELSSEWLTSALGRRVESFEMVDIGVGVGIFGEIVRVAPTYGDDDVPGPRSLIAKFPTKEPGNLAVGHALDLYRREVGFYRDAAPTTPVRLPGCYHAQHDDHGNVVMLLEDLGEMDMGDQVLGATPAQADLVVDALASLHARWWRAPELATFAWLPGIADPMYAAVVPTIFTAGLEPLRHSWADRVGSDGIDLAERVEAVFPAVLHHCGTTAPQTLLHTDSRLDNLLFDDTSVAIIDWQLAVKGRGVADLCYFIASSMNVADQRAHWQRLVRRWLDRIVVAGVTDYSWEQALADYRESVLMLLSGPMSLVGTFDSGNARGAAMVDAFVTRYFSHALDVDALDALDAMTR